MKTAMGGLERGAMMFNHRLTCTAAVAVAIVAAGAPAASAEPYDSRLSIDALPAFPTSAVEPPQDLRNPDTRDFAEGRGTYNSPEVVVVKAPAPVAEQATGGGIDWEDVGIGAGGLLTASLIALGGAMLVVQRRSARTHAAH
jgi:hypothetical protein